MIKSRRAVYMIVAFITLLAVIALVIVLIVPQLISCVQLLVAEVPGAMKELVGFLEKWNLVPENIADILNGIDWKSKIEQLIGVVSSGIGSIMDVVVTAVSSVFFGIVTAFIGIIFAIYLLSGKDKIGKQVKCLMTRYLKDSWNRKVMYVLSVLNDCFHRYIVGQCMEAVILGSLCAFSMMILRLPYAAMIGALIPVAGRILVRSSAHL